MSWSKEAAEGGGDGEDDDSTTATAIQKIILKDDNLRTVFPFWVRHV